MKPTRLATIAVLLAALHCAYPDATTTSAFAADTPATASKDGWYSQRVDAAFVAGYAVLPKPEELGVGSNGWAFGGDVTQNALLATVTTRF